MLFYVALIELNVYFAETGESVLTIKGPQGRINRAVWGPLNKTIISAGEDATIRIWDSEVCFHSFLAYLLCGATRSKTLHLKVCPIATKVIVGDQLWHFMNDCLNINCGLLSC